MTSSEPPEIDSSAWTGPVDADPTPQQAARVAMSAREKRIGIALLLTILVTYLTDEVWLLLLRSISPQQPLAATGQVTPVAFRLRYRPIGKVFYVHSWQAAVHQGFAWLGTIGVILLIALALRMRFRRP